MGKKRKLRKLLREALADGGWDDGGGGGAPMPGYGSYGAAARGGYGPQGPEAPRGGDPRWGAPPAGAPGFFGSGATQQFLIGALIGGVATYVLSDKAMREKIIASAVKLYSTVMGGVEEIKEQVADAQAEMAAGQQDQP